MNALIWIKNTVVLLFSVFFLIFGVNILWNSFSVNNPHEFIMLFFSASLMILVCIVGIIYFIFRFFPNKQDEMDNDDEKQ
jgi:TRAP-type C4-dicarboxylate transport system permease small subunit